jgi:putative membrane protein
MKKLLTCGTVVLALSVVPALAQTPGSAGSQNTQTGTRMTNASPSKADQNFVTKAAKGGMAEVQLGKLAADKASNPEVKNFAQRMVDDHSKANDELKSIANQKNITLPTAVDAKDKATYDRLSRMSGAAFDRAYMQNMLNDHKTDVADFQYEARAGADTDVRTFASKTLPTLQEHLKMAETTNGAVATSGTRSKAGSATGTTGSSPNPAPGNR